MQCMCVYTCVYIYIYTCQSTSTSTYIYIHISYIYIYPCRSKYFRIAMVYWIQLYLLQIRPAMIWGGDIIDDSQSLLRKYLDP